MMMRILLIEPSKPAVSIGGEDVFLFEPLALEYVAAGVCQDHEVQILDHRLDKNLDVLLDDFRPEVVGITSYTVHVNVVKRLSEHIKAWNPKVFTVVGGHHVTVKHEDFLCPSIDVVVKGEGVFPFQEIVSRLAQGHCLEGVPGTILMTASGPVHSPHHPPKDLDALPLPARHLTRPYRHEYYSEWMKPLASLRTSRGCPFRCRFCAEWKVAGGRYMRRDPEKVVEELAGIGEECVFFADDESLIDVARMTRLAGLIREAGIRKRYFCYGRSDTITRNPELLRSWRDVGLERVFVGLEFFRDEDLDYVRKNSTSEDNETAIRILQGLGIDVYASFMVRPDFTREDFATLRTYCRRLDLNFASFAVLTPLPGTDLYEEVENRLITHDYDLFDFLHTQLPTTLPLKEFFQECDGLYTNAIPLGKQISLLRKYRLTDIPGLLVKWRRFHERLRHAHLDY
jgi:radical SAM superfamily enzyme YgiQ (UPF0313 family)